MAQADPEVVIGPGRVRGRLESGACAFRGIPYAQPPLGRLRFAGPERPAAWDGVRDASAFGPPSPQLTPGGTSSNSTGEWLTVNVWTPDPSAGRLPVMVWVHGGAYLFGSAAEPTYDGTEFAMAGTVLVSCNYRLGMEGFGQIPGAPANRGLLDLVAVLRWVAENIDAFGGDPGNVTLFGESAGAGLIAALLAVDSVSGLFTRAIAQSVPGTFFSPELATDITAEVASEAGVPSARESLSRADPAALVAAAARVTGRMREFSRWGAVRLTDTPFSPVVDGEVLPRTPWRALLAGAARDVELLTGHNRDEYRLFLAMSGRLGKITDEDADTALEAFAPAPNGPAGYRAAYGDGDPGRLFELVFSDWLFRMPTLHLAQAHAASGGTTYLYELRAEAPALNGALGSCHALDLPLIFGPRPPGGEPCLSDQLLGPDPSPALVGLGDRMREDWIRFASGEDPGWSPYGTEHRTTRVYDMPPDVRSYPEEASMRLWQRHQFDVLDLAEDPAS